MYIYTKIIYFAYNFFSFYYEDKIREQIIIVMCEKRKIIKNFKKILYFNKI